jgi:bifunctional oligoribonuclease and PAP phosphatase NrnA
MSYTSNTTLPEIASWLRIARTVAVLTHSKPDGDAVGSTLAVARALAIAGRNRDGGVTATPVYVGPFPTWFEQVTAPTTTRLVTGAGEAPGVEPDAIVILDTGSWAQLEEVKAWLAHRNAKAVVIDHHLQGDAASSARRYVDPKAAAACQIVAELCRLLLGVPSVANLPVEVAEPLYMGLMTDTGWFRHSNVNPGALRLAADLLEAGVNHSRLYELIEQTDRAARLRLMARALGSLELHDHGRVAVMSISKKDFDECGGAPGDSSGFAETPLSVATVKVSAMLTEFERSEKGGPMTKISMRSKTGEGSVDVNVVGQKFGGGGHARAAGARIFLPLAEAKKQIVEALK